MKTKKNTNKTFFKGKRSWSIIKDRILGRYMPPYLTKVRTLGFPILLIDCFAGEGKFEDQKPGSPLIICQMVEKYAKDKAKCVFVNKKKSHHKTLVKVLETFIEKRIAFPVHADSQSLLNEFQQSKRNFTLFAYLDPFGLKGCEFEVIEKLLRRAGSTEILINLNMPALHRHAACNAVHQGRGSTRMIQDGHRLLDKALGGNYWKKYMFDESLSREVKENKVAEEYMRKLRAILPYVGSCPVSEKEGSVRKYFIVFGSKHPHAMTLMNDTMCTAYNEYMHEVSVKELPLLELASPDWRAARDSKKRELRRVILETLKTDAVFTRLELWTCIINRHFMAFVETEYKNIVQDLLSSGEIHSPTARHSKKRLNDNCILKLGREERLAANE